MVLNGSNGGGAKSTFNEDFLEVYGRAGFWAGGLVSTQ